MPGAVPRTDFLTTRVSRLSRVTSLAWNLLPTDVDNIMTRSKRLKTETIGTSTDEDARESSGTSIGKAGATQVSEFIENFKKETEALVTDVFPQKVLDIEEVYRKMIAEKVSMVHEGTHIPIPEPPQTDGEEPSSKKRKVDGNGIDGLPVPAQGTLVLVFPGGKAAYNQYIHNWAERIKPIIMDLMEHANMVKMWISFLIPKIEDGNNFGVSIQEDTMAEARQVETESATYLDQLSRYYVTRAKIISKVAKYPHIEDYRQSIRELDEKQVICLRLTLCEMRNHYASLHDIIIKNMDKIKKPRSGNAENLY